MKEQVSAGFNYTYITNKVILTIVALCSLIALVFVAFKFLLTGSTLYETEIAWPRYGALLTHVIAGTLVFMIGAFQLWSGTNQRKMKLHPILGRIYVIGVIIGSIGAVVSVSMQEDPFGDKLFTTTAPVIVSSFAWLVTTLMAWYSIYKRDFEQHKEWMIRSYVLTFFAFAGVRILSLIGFLIFGGFFGADPKKMESFANFMLWSFSVFFPLFGAEIYIQFKKIANKKTA